MGHPCQQVVALLRPHIVESSGLNLFLYPGTKDDFVDNLENMGVEQCIPRYALRFEGHMIDLDLLFYIVDVLKTADGGVIFYSPESRIIDFKLITRPGGGLDKLCPDT